MGVKMADSCSVVTCRSSRHTSGYFYEELTKNSAENPFTLE